MINDEEFSLLIEKLESKHRDCIAFSKKYETRKMEELKQYYEGAKWALEFSIAQLKELNNKSSP
jgi:hypothetical protein